MSNKKLWLLILFIFLGINHVSAMTPTVEYIDNVYSNRVSDSKTYSGQLGFIVMDGKILYCLDPYLIVGTDYSITNNSSLSEENKQYFELVSSYVENKVNNRNVYYYMAAQELIWEKIIGDRVYWTTEKNGSTEIDITDYKEEIEDYIHNFYQKPSFHDSIIYGDHSKEIILEDTNKILNSYEVVGGNAKIVNNGLYISVVSPDTEEIKLVRKKNGSNSIYYYSSNHQSLAYLSGNLQVESSIKIKTNHYEAVNLKIEFYDRGYNIPVNGEIKFKIHNIDTDEYSDELTTSNGIYNSDFTLQKGHYEIILINVPREFYIDNPYIFEIEQDNYSQDYYIRFPLDNAMGRINITNYKDNSGYTVYAADNIYNLYGDILISKDKEFTTIELSNPGGYIMALLFGKYYILDPIDGKKYEFEIYYKDQYTPFVDYYLEINSEKEDQVDEKEEDKKDEQVDEKEEDKKDEQVDEKEDDKKEDQVDEKEDNKKDDQVDEKNNHPNEKNDEDKSQNIKEKPKNEDNKDNKMEDVSNNTKENTIQKNNTDQDIEKVLPNTYNYIGFVKLILVIVLIANIVILQIPKHD